MNMIMDNSSQHFNHQSTPLPTHQQTHQHAMTPPQRSADLHISTASSSSSSPGLLSPNVPHLNNNNNNNKIIRNNNNNNENNNLSPKITTNNNSNPTNTTTTTTTTTTGKATLKRSFDVAFLMMPDERIKQKQQQAEKHARLCEAMEQAQPQYPTDLSPRAHGPHNQHPHATHLHMQHMQHLQQLHAHDQAVELFNLQQQQLHHHHQQQQQQHQHQENNGRRYPQITIRSPRIYDDPSVVIPLVDTLAGDQSPMKSAFTKVISTSVASASSSGSRCLESPLQPAPPLSPDQLSCPSMSPPVATTPPRTNSGNGSLSNCSSNSNNNISNGNNPASLNPSIVYQSFRPEYQFNGAFQTVSHVQALQAQRLKQQLLYRPITGGGGGIPGGPNGNGNQTPTPPGDFIAGYSGFPFPPNGPPAGHHPFATVAPPELPRIVQNPAAAAILSTLIPPTLASTFTLTAQNVCAKCNISFRMTSDLVYHMRSHHKSEVACDPNRRKREEKLKCPVCQESFRERHHLTRHMTAHQDKESDQAPNGSAGNANEQIINVGTGGGSGNGGRNYSARVTGGAAAK